MQTTRGDATARKDFVICNSNVWNLEQADILSPVESAEEWRSSDAAEDLIMLMPGDRSPLSYQLPVG